MTSRPFTLAATVALLATHLSGCAMQDLSRNVYEGARLHNESLRSTPLEKSAAPSMSYDEYDRERKVDSAQRRE
jgi:hypothetical protein